MAFVRNFIKRYKSYLVVILFTILGHGLGFSREISIAYLFGASSISDGLLVGLAPATLFLGMLGVGYANAVMARIKSLDNHRQIIESFHPMVIAAGFSTVVFFFFNEAIIGFTAPGLTGQGLLLAVEIVQFSAIAAGVAIIYFWFRGIRYLEGQFLRVSLSELMPNIGILIGILLLYQLFGVRGIAIGITLGYILQLVVVFDSKRIELKGFGSDTLLSADAKIIYKNTFYSALGMSGVIISLFVDRYFASQLAEGTVASINFGYKVMTLPLYTVVFAIVTVMFPKLIALRDNTVDFKRAKIKTSVILVIFSLFSSLIFIMFSAPIISLLFQYGQFDQSDVATTAPLLSIYAAGLVAHALVLFHSKVCFSVENFKTPLIAGTCGALVNFVLDVVLVNVYGANGLAAASTVAAFVNASIVVFAQKKPALAV